MRLYVMSDYTLNSENTLLNVENVKFSIIIYGIVKAAQYGLED